MENKDSADEALAAVASSRAEVADRLVTPWWYHPALGVLLGVQALLVGQVLGTAGLVLIVLPILGMLGLATLYSHLTGIDVTSVGGRGRRSSRLQWALMGLGMAGLLAALLGGAVLDLAWVPWVAAGLLIVMAVLVGRAYDVALRAELRESPA